MNGSSDRWRPISTAPERVVVETKIDDDAGGRERNVAKLFREGRMWFLPDSSVYVYYKPTHWRPLECCRP